MWDKYKNFGVLKVERNRIRIYSSQISNSLIYVGELITDAKWSGDEIIVTLNDGKVRKYKNQYSYITI